MKVLLAVFFMGSFNSLYAQVFFSTDPNYLKCKAEQNNLLSRFRSSYPDTTIDELSNIFPRNFLGNVGLPSPDYLLKYGTADLGFRLYKVPYSLDRIEQNEVLYMNSSGPYVSLTGVKGRMSFQAFKMLYAQSFRSGFNISLRFKRYASAGYYDNQLSTTQNFYANSHFTTKNKRLGYYFYFLENGNSNAENGGVATPLNEVTALEKKNFLPVNLSAANRNNKERKIVFNPWIRLSRLKDSVTRAAHFLQFKSAYTNNLYWYSDKGLKDGFYKKNYLDTVATNDSTRVKQFINEVNYSVQSANRRLGFSFGYKNEVNLLWQKYDSTFVNHLAQSELYYNNFNWDDTSYHSGLETRLNAQYVAEGPNKGNYRAEWNSVYWINLAKKRSLFLDAVTENRSADYIYNNWVANNFFWFNNGFKNQQQTQVQTGISLGGLLKASVYYQNVFNYLYFDNNALPAQYHHNINNTGVSLSLAKVFFKHLGLGLSHTYQNTSHTRYFRMPENVTGAKIYFVTNSRKNILQFQLGAQAQLYQSFKAYAYMPSTQAFYLQESFHTPANPFVDIYMNVRIRPVSVFFKIENVLQGYTSSNYAFVPGYYQQERAFKFGVSWVFFD